jgi:anaerobic ribonucleoside-triphosphate reductase activating protein
LDYYDIIVEENELLYGPGKRLVLWVQGCSIRCKGCTNQHLWSREGAKKISSKDLIVLISGYPDLEGITLLGGEPADQLDELIPVMKWSKHNNLSVILFTGYEIEDFLQPNEIEFITYTDLVICGPFQLVNATPSSFSWFNQPTNHQNISKISRI